MHTATLQLGSLLLRRPRWLLRGVVAALATLAGVEMGLKLHGVALAGSGVQAAMDYFAAHPQNAGLKAAA